MGARGAGGSPRPYRGPSGSTAPPSTCSGRPLVGAWPIDEERLQAYATKAVREAKMHTGWSDPDDAYEAAVAAFVAAS